MVKKVKVLVIDNDPLFRGLVSQVIELQGAVVTSIGSCTDALEVMARGEFYDLVLSDIDLGGRCSGIDIASKLHSDNPDSLIMLMSGSSPDEITRRNGSLGNFPLLMKPFRISELTEAIERYRPGLFSAAG